MTVWKAGMLARCIKRGDWLHYSGGAPSLGYSNPRYGDIVRVCRVGPCTACGILGLWFEGMNPAGYGTTRFEPLIDQADDAELIARIKRCKPAKAPVLTDNRHERTGYGEAL